MDMPRRIGEVLLEEGLITENQLKEALEYQKKFGGRLGWILTTLGYINRLEFFRALAKSCDLELVENVNEIKKAIDVEFLKKFDPEKLSSYECIPARVEGDEVLVFTSYPCSKKLKEFLERFFPDKKTRVKLITDRDLIIVLEWVFKDRFIDKAVHGLLYLEPQLSASQVFSKGQVIFFGVLAYLSLLWIYFHPLSFLITVIALVQIFYLSSILFKFIVSLAGTQTELEEYISEEEVKKLKDKDLPVYTILIPVYKESEVIGTLIRSLKRIDYPKNKLDIILLLEEDDKETLEAAKKEKPPSNWRFIIVPNSQPRTKPKACNYGLLFSRGRYLTIYDAEDIPEPDQLKKAILAFRKGGEKYICFQVQLNFFNKDENFLTKMFTLEYSYWFDYLLPGLFRLKLPIPLGGTSNHFDKEKLEKIGAWDPFNTTEDADLGVRAFAEGYKVGVINSTTYEEANARLKNWIRQRSRWIKGYMQTWLVYSRNSRRLYKMVGLKGFIAFHLLIGGTPFTFLVNPIMWLLLLIWILTKTKLIEPLFPPHLLYVSIFNLLLGNFIGVYLNMLAVFRRKYYNLLPYAFLNPIYWILHSLAAYLALYELFVKPFYWQKTQHGITKYKPKLEEAS